MIKNIGVQLVCEYAFPSWFKRTHTKFVDRSKIMNVVMAEGIDGWQIRTYLALLIASDTVPVTNGPNKNTSFNIGGDHSLVVLFQRLLPRLHHIQPVYHQLKRLIQPSYEHSET